MVFQGKLNGDFIAYDAATGEKLWSHNVKSGAASGPGTYQIDGEQYVTITTGWGGSYALSAGYGFDEAVPPVVGKVVTFKLGGNEIIPDHDLPMIERTAKGEPFGDEAMLADGMVKYSRNCMVCHGPLAVSSGVLPDLRWSPISGSEAAWEGIVLGGNLASNGMVSFDNVLDKDGAEAIRAYVLAQAKAYEEPASPEE